MSEQSNSCRDRLIGVAVAMTDERRVRDRQSRRFARCVGRAATLGFAVALMLAWSSSGKAQVTAAATASAPATAPAGNASASTTADDAAGAALDHQMIDGRRVPMPRGPMPAAIDQVTPRILFDSIRTAGKPPLKLPVMRSANDFFTHESMRAFGQSSPRNPWLLVPDERKARAIAAECFRNGWVLTVNIELLPLDARSASPEMIERATRLVAQVVAWVRDEAPTIRVGFYAFMPGRAYYEPLNLFRAAEVKPGDSMYAWHQGHLPKFQSEFDRWLESNARLRFATSDSGVRAERGLADLFDFTAPSVYLFYDQTVHSIAGQVDYVRANIREARKYEKPVYAYIWPRLHRTPERVVPMLLWTETVRAAAEDADGMILFDQKSRTYTGEIALRVESARLLAKSAGRISNREIYDALRPRTADPQLQLQLAELLDMPVGVGDASTTRPMETGGETP
jgi:hypothetical protein